MEAEKCLGQGPVGMNVAASDSELVMGHAGGASLYSTFVLLYTT